MRRLLRATYLAVLFIIICSKNAGTSDIIYVGQPKLYKEVKIYYDILLDYELQDYIFEICKKEDVDIETMLAIIKTESDFRQDVKFKNQNRKGHSLGISQLNENHVCWYRDLTGLGDEFDINDTQHNILAGVLVYKHYYDYWENKGYVEDELFVRSIMSYNRGVKGTRRYKGDIFKNNYVIKVKNNKEEIKCAKVIRIKV